MAERILIPLGAPNSPDGVLSAIAQSRLDLCLKIYTDTDLVLCTGGWGKHFNISKKPHALYAKEYLLKNGVSSQCFLDFALSANTVEDAVKVKEIISTFTEPHLVVITSDFHLERAKLIFTEIVKGYTIQFMGAKVELPEEQRKKMVAHEKRAIRSIMERGLFY